MLPVVCIREERVAVRVALIRRISAEHDLRIILRRKRHFDLHETDSCPRRQVHVVGFFDSKPSNEPRNSTFISLGVASSLFSRRWSCRLACCSQGRREPGTRSLRLRLQWQRAIPNPAVPLSEMGSTLYRFQLALLYLGKKPKPSYMTQEPNSAYLLGLKTSRYSALTRTQTYNRNLFTSLHSCSVIPFLNGIFTIKGE